MSVEILIEKHVIDKFSGLRLNAALKNPTPTVIVRMLPIACALDASKAKIKDENSLLIYNEVMDFYSRNLNNLKLQELLQPLYIYNASGQSNKFSDLFHSLSKLVETVLISSSIPEVAETLSRYESNFKARNKTLIASSTLLQEVLKRIEVNFEYIRSTKLSEENIKKQLSNIIDELSVFNLLKSRGKDLAYDIARGLNDTYPKYHDPDYKFGLFVDRDILFIKNYYSDIPRQLIPVRDMMDIKGKFKRVDEIGNYGLKVMDRYPDLAMTISMLITDMASDTYSQGNIKEASKYIGKDVFFSLYLLLALGYRKEGIV